MMQFRKGRIDPLELLRDSIMQKKSIKLRNKNSEFKLLFENNIELKCTSETAWKSKSSREYNLGALWWFLECQQKNIDNKEYRNKALDMGINFVGRADQQEIIDYFTGKIEYTECINAEKRKKHESKKDDEDPGSSKKVKQEQEKEPLSEKDFNLKVFDEILRFEKPTTTRNRLFRVNDRSFEDILNISKKIFSGQCVTSNLETAEIDQGDPLKFKQFSASVLQFSYLNEILKSKEKPIIIVPQIYEIGNLCLKNAQQFLEQGIYIDPNTVKFTSESRVLTFKTKLRISNIELSFQIYDTPNMIPNWKRVVCAFLRGSTYELKSYPEQDPQVLFKRIKGYNMKFESEKFNDQIKKWNVKVLELHTSKRHQDREVANQFWEDLERFLLRPVIKQ